MFEQESYSFESPVEPLHEGDLFFGYETGRWRFDNRFYMIIAIAAVLNFGFFGILAQTNVLTARGCDSPFVGRVCQVLDMAYLGSKLYGTEREYIDAEYDLVSLDEADVVWIDQTGVPAALEYPVGYFQIANPEQFAMQQAMLNGDPANGFQIGPGFPPVTPSTPSGSSLIDTTPNEPRNNPKARPKDLPSSPFDLSDVEGDDTTVSTDGDKKGGSTNVDPKKTKGDGTANANTNKPEAPTSDAIQGIDINKRPLEEFGNGVNKLLAENAVDLQTPFIGSAKGRLTKEGRIDAKTLKMLIESPDPEMQQVVQEGIRAIDAAGYLQWLKAISGKDFELLLKQDDANISATVQSDMESETRAKSIKSSLDLLMSAAKVTKSGEGASQNDKDDLVLLDGAKVQTIGKRVVITFVIPKEIAHPMIQRKLAEQAAANKEEGTGGSSVPTGNANAVK